MKSLSMIAAIFGLTVLSPSTATCSDISEIETKYLMFKLPVVKFDGIDQLFSGQKKRIKLGEKTFLDQANVEPIRDSKNSRDSRNFLVKSSLKIDSITLNPGCELMFAPSRDKSYQLYNIDCTSGSAEYENIKMKANYTTGASLTFNHFSASELTADSKIPLPDGKFLYPGDKISVIDWVVVAPTNFFKLEKK